MNKWIRMITIIEGTTVHLGRQSANQSDGHAMSNAQATKTAPPLPPPSASSSITSLPPALTLGQHRSRSRTRNYAVDQSKIITLIVKWYYFVGHAVSVVQGRVFGKVRGG